MRVADFFCGAGGFSEGFRMMGFDVAFALDSWKPAIETHEFNHPRCKHSDRDILKIGIDEIDSIIPDTEVMIGSPPCVSFSGSNKAGKADKGLGIELMEKYLQIIAYKKNKKGSMLKHWILENVPNADKHLKDSYTFEELGLNGGKKIALKAKRRLILNAADYGAPQTRRRLFYGDYPLPTKTNDMDEWVKLGDVIASLSRGSPIVEDINHGFTIPKTELSDHLYDTTIEDFEWKAAKRLKRDHSYMGKMSFPENERRPSRTIMATMSSSTRESMIIGTGKEGIYRRPTIREIASLMSYPITYQFVAESEGNKYKLVGNSVCCKASTALAKAILDHEGIQRPYRPNTHERFKEPPFNLNGQPGMRKQPKPRRLTARFRMHVPGLKVGSFRVDIDNHESNHAKKAFIWRAVLHAGSGKNALHAIVSQDVIESMISFVNDFDGFKEDVSSIFKTSLQNPDDFQKAYCRLLDNTKGPEEALYKIKNLVDKHFPEDVFSDIYVKNMGINLKRKGFPIRIIAALYAANHVTGNVMSKS